MIGWLWRQSDVGSVTRWAGWRVPDQQTNAWVCPTFHPAALLHEESDDKRKLYELIITRHLRRAVKLAGKRPWPDGPPDYRKDVTVCYDDAEAAAIMDRMREAGRPVAFDFESTTLKPDPSWGQIWSCSFSDGETTVSYPWRGKAVDATAELLKSDCPKIGHNAKHEQRWVMRAIGGRVRNWAWDTMLAAHALDNRKGITGLKFLSYAMLGQDDYDSDVKRFLKARSPNASNTVGHADLGKVLLYGGMDSLLTWHVAVIQARQLGVELCSSTMR